MIFNLIRWITVLIIAFFAGKLMTRIKMPSILGWLIVGMIFGPHAIGILPQKLLEAEWYKITIMWMQCAFGLMLGTELIWKKLKNYGKSPDCYYAISIPWHFCSGQHRVRYCVYVD